MSTKFGKLIPIYEQIINEVGDLKNIKPFPINGENFAVEYNNEKLRGKVSFTQANIEMFELPPIAEKWDEAYNIGYSIEGFGSQYLKGNLKLLLKILKTVSIIISNYIKQNPDNLYLIFAESKYGMEYEDPQKLLIYGEILKKHLPNQFRMGETNFAGIAKGIFIIKK